MLQTIIVRVETEARSPTSLFTQNSEDLRQWAVLSRQCSAVVTELEDVLNKYKSLAPKNRHRNWERIRMGTKNFDDLHKRLVTRTESLSAFLTVLGLSSQGRVENNVLPEILRRFDDLAACSRTTNGSTQSSLTTYDDDDKEVWRRFRRDLIHSGFRSPDIEKYDAALKTYIGRLQRSGGLDEDEPGEVPLSASTEILAGYPDSDLDSPLISSPRPPQILLNIPTVDDNHQTDGEQLNTHPCKNERTQISTNYKKPSVEDFSETEDQPAYGHIPVLNDEELLVGLMPGSPENNYTGETRSKNNTGDNRTETLPNQSRQRSNLLNKSAPNFGQSLDKDNIEHQDSPSVKYPQTPISLRALNQDRPPRITFYAATDELSIVSYEEESSTEWSPSANSDSESITVSEDEVTPLKTSYLNDLGVSSFTKKLSIDAISTTGTVGIDDYPGYDSDQSSFVSRRRITRPNSANVGSKRRENGPARSSQKAKSYHRVYSPRSYSPPPLDTTPNSFFPPSPSLDTMPNPFTPSPPPLNTTPNSFIPPPPPPLANENPLQITWEQLPPSELHPPMERHVVPEGWRYRLDDKNRLFFIDVYARGKEKRCFWHLPKEEVELEAKPDWDRVCNVYGRVHWVHRASKIVSYEHPAESAQIAYNINGQLLLRQPDGTFWYWEHVDAKKFKLDDEDAACQISSSVWKDGISDEAVKVRGQLWWFNDDVIESPLRLSRWLNPLRSGPLRVIKMDV